MKGGVPAVDLIFCVDLTSSMLGFIEEARTHLGDVLGGLVVDHDIDLRVAVVGYRDYDSRGSICTRVGGQVVVESKGTGEVPTFELVAFSHEIGRLQARMEELKAASEWGNSDAAEAVLGGLKLCLAQPWRKEATRLVVLIGDAPPHGCGADGGFCPDRFNSDPSGWTPEWVVRGFRGAHVKLYALGMVPSILPHFDPIMEERFAFMAQGTGGTYRSVRDEEAAIRTVSDIVADVFGQVSRRMA